jgi:hypothetical protein
MNEELGVNVQEVAEPAIDTTAEPETTVETGETEVETAEQPQRDFERDAGYARLRREAEQAKREAEALKKELANHNFVGKDGVDLAMQLEASRTNKPIEEVRAERERLSRLEELEARNKELEQRELERHFEKDLDLLKKTYPDLKETDVFKIGNGEFAKLRAAGIDTLIAYEAILAKQAKTTKDKPPSTGSVKSDAPAPEKEFYTNEELDRLTKKDLDNPKILEKALASFGKLK